MVEKYVTTLLSPEPSSTLAELANRITSAYGDQAGRVIRLDWLAEHQACDLIFVDLEPEAAEVAARQAIDTQPIDIIVQESGSRRKQLLITDMDSTIITVECIDEIADFVGKKSEVAVITERAMNGELDFKQALVERVALLAGLPETTLQTVYDERVRFMPGARELVATMKADGAHCLLVSGGFSFFTSRVRDALGFDGDSSNLLEVKDGKLTGRVTPPILDRDAKLQSLLTTCQQRGLSLQDSMAVGDGANDLPMIMAAGLGVAYHAKPHVRANARARLDHCDLSALLYAQGYRQEEIISS